MGRPKKIQPAETKNAGNAALDPLPGAVSSTLLYDIEGVDISDPAQVKEFKNHLTREAYTAAMQGDRDGNAKTAAIKNVMEIVAEAEKSFNYLRKEALEDLGNRLEALEVEMDRLINENAELRARLKVYEDRGDIGTGERKHDG